MKPETLAIIESGMAKKGDVLGIARIAAIMAAKKNSGDRQRPTISDRKRNENARKAGVFSKTAKS